MESFVRFFQLKVYFPTLSLENLKSIETVTFVFDLRTRRIELNQRKYNGEKQIDILQKETRNLILRCIIFNNNTYLKASSIVRI